ncbi:uncharacterized protein LOC118756189 [Rhagoletis pomonella]|uniref:uncharacterized protein LOC118756189 n=1 Tax=Rhagoletis pomonella TaxID=28610 RepID=UPI0017836698|nr:uncharacterized protein LOC118756189 [Rhagoletis pomonella]
MHQIAEDERLRYPAAENVLKHEMYVDDILSGDHTFERAEQKRLHVTEALKSACMELRKWSSNHALLLTTIPLEHQCKLTPLNWGTGDAVKTLGMYWLPNQDFLKYKIPSFVHTGSTKRIILSNIARLFDPLGLIAPIIISAKIILKQVTMAKHLNENGSLAPLDWDDPVPESTAQRWQEFCNTMFDIDDIVIPRWLRFNPRTNSVQLHAFCDGSSEAYAVAVYIRVEQPDGMSHTALITAKSKISPTKPLTIPRTELCGAVLAIKLMKWVVANQRWTAETISSFYWTDATIVLHWISGDVNRWKTFVSNRVAYILEHSTPSQWSHVSTRENPADCATRGLLPAELAKFKLWWHGPNWLAHSLTEWPSRKIGDCDIDAVMTEAKPCKITVNLTSAYDSLINRFSSYTKLLRVTAYLLRFCNNARGKSQRLTGFLSTEEIQRGMHCIVRIVQLETFAAEIKEIRASKSVPHKSKLSNLSPIMQDDILRIRGRLRHSKLPFNRRCPIILPNGHFITELVIKHSHHTTLHGGAQLTLAHTRYQFWIINGRQAVRRIIQKCVRCFRTQPTTSAQIMGDLPLHRVNPPGRPFEATGVDYTGAIELKAARLRGTSFYKGYIAIFICVATKAIHLEAVTGLTAEHFMWALDRFTGRRGLCRHLYSDNGTNFVGADNALKVAYSRLMSDVETVIAPKLATQSIQWHFNPPHSPNFGGLWEANVKSVKHHLKRVAVNTRLTYEELSTVLVRNESCLNSRPLCPLTADPDDLDSLTPAHFLIGDSMLAPTECRPQATSFREQFLTQQKMVHQFWKQWSHDWLANLQKRPKWCKEADNLKVDDLVIVKDDRVPPTHWILGRVVELHPGADALVRVVTLKTKQGKLKRSISKLCRLPISA